MTLLRSCTLLPLVLIALLWRPVFGWADGCVLKKKGTYIPEKEQRALIEWEEGHERLFLATRIAEYAGPTLWVVPVPGPPHQVQAEPVKKFPHVVYTESIVEQANKLLTITKERTSYFNSGLMPIWFTRVVTSKSKGGKKGQAKVESKVNVHLHVEKLGVVVEVITTKSTEAVDRYLAGKQLDVRAANITALEPYLQQEYTLVCCWTSTGTKKPLARAIRIDFPSPAVFYPLRPTRVYTSDIDASIYVRGWVVPQPEIVLPGLHCEYVHGNVSDDDEDSADDKKPLYSDMPHEPLTRVNLSPSPRGWTQDLLMDEGAPYAIEVAQVLNFLDKDGTLLIPLVLGGLLGSFLPWIVIPRDQRRSLDFAWAVFVGAAICLSIYASAIVFCAWSWLRKPAWPQPPGKSARWLIFWISLGITIGISVIFSLGYWLIYLERIPDPAGAFVLLVILMILVGFPVGTIALLFASAGRKGLWLFVFAGVHWAATFGLCSGLQLWFSFYA
jgi:hypothetical protein